MGHGIALGYSGIPYAFSQISGLLDDSELQKQSVTAVMTIDEGSLSTEKNLDVFTGIAGSCLALLEVFQSTQEEAILDKARICGKILLQGYEANKQNRKPISDHRQETMYEFAYGAAGINETLRRLAFVTKDSRFQPWQNQENSKLETVINTNNILSSQEKSLEKIKSGEIPDCFMPGLFTGLAGSGYYLLQAYAPQSFSHIFSFTNV